MLPVVPTWWRICAAWTPAAAECEKARCFPVRKCECDPSKFERLVAPANQKEQGDFHEILIDPCNGGPVRLLGAASATDLAGTAKSAGQFSILLKAAAVAGMDKTLSQPGPYTVFAPTDAAFNALPPGMLDMLMKPENKDMLKKVLGYHMLFGRLTTGDLKDDKSAATTTIGAPVVLRDPPTPTRLVGFRVRTAYCLCEGSHQENTHEKADDYLRDGSKFSGMRYDKFARRRGCSAGQRQALIGSTCAALCAKLKTLLSTTRCYLRLRSERISCAVRRHMVGHHSIGEFFQRKLSSQGR